MSCHRYTIWRDNKYFTYTARLTASFSEPYLRVQKLLLIQKVLDWIHLACYWLYLWTVSWLQFLRAERLRFRRSKYSAWYSYLMHGCLQFYTIYFLTYRFMFLSLFFYFAFLRNFSSPSAVFPSVMLFILFGCFFLLLCLFHSCFSDAISLLLQIYHSASSLSARLWNTPKGLTRVAGYKPHGEWWNLYSTSPFPLLMFRNTSF